MWDLVQLYPIYTLSIPYLYQDQKKGTKTDKKTTI